MKRILLLIVVAAAVMAQAPPQHMPEHCARVASFTPEGERIHACTCKRMGTTTDGEDCQPSTEDQSCTAYCKPEWCAYPAMCDAHPDEEPKP